MDIVKFVETVQQMRNTQNEYFRTRSSIAMTAAKKLEKSVDEMVKAYAKPEAISQSDMFGNPLPAAHPDLKHELKFCLDEGMVVNENGVYIYQNASDGSHSFNLPFILSDYRDWLNCQGISKDLQRA
jgi:hypothetical protein